MYMYVHVSALPACLRQRDNALNRKRKADKMKSRPDLQPATIGNQKAGAGQGANPARLLYQMHKGAVSYE